MNDSARTGFDNPEDEDDDEFTSRDDIVSAVDAIELLTADHDAVKQLFEEYESLLDDDAPDGERQALAAQICLAITVHAAIEEEILYPAARDALAHERLVDVATVEHATAKQLVAELEAMKASEPLFDARITVLGEYTRHHIDEEEEELLPQLADAGVDLEALGAALAERRQELMRELGADERV